MRMRIATGMVMAAALSAAASVFAQGGPPPAKVRLEPAKMERVERWREVTGELAAVRRSTIAAEESARVESIELQAGDHVKEGDVLAVQDDDKAVIDAERAAATLATRKAVVVEREAVLEKARRDLQVWTEAMAKGGATEIERADRATAVAAAEAKLAEARSDVNVAEAELAQAKKVAADMVIRAPFTGIVTRKHTERGQWLGEGDPVVELIQISELDAWLDVPEHVLRRIDPGYDSRLAEEREWTPASELEVVLRIDALPPGDRELRAKVSGIVPAGDVRSRLFPVRVRLSNEAGKLRPGMSLTAQVPTGEAEESLTIPRDALMRSETGAFVYFDGGGSAAVAPVSVRYAVKDRLVVSSPVLKPGMRVVVEGTERLFPTQPLIDLDAPAPGPGGTGAGGAPAASGKSGGGEVATEDGTNAAGESRAERRN